MLLSFAGCFVSQHHAKCIPGMVIRMSDSRIPRQLLYGELMCDSRKQGRLKLKWSSIRPRELEASAADRSAAVEENRRQRLAAAGDRRHRTASASIRTTDCRCDTCERLCASSFGLRSHALSSLRAQIVSSSDTDGLPTVAITRAVRRDHQATRAVRDDHQATRAVRRDHQATRAVRDDHKGGQGRPPDHQSGSVRVPRVWTVSYSWDDRDDHQTTRAVP